MADLAQRGLRALRALNFEQRVAAAAALLLVVSTFGPFSFVEAAEVLLALGVLALLFARGEGRAFHLPFGDGTIIAGAGIWAAALIVVRLFDRSLGQNLLALACAALLFLAGARERAKRPPDDLPAEQPPAPRERRRRARRARPPGSGPARRPAPPPRPSRCRHPSSSPTGPRPVSSCGWALRAARRTTRTRRLRPSRCRRPPRRSRRARRGGGETGGAGGPGPKQSWVDPL